jgi:hemolysin activation/secretion protein
MIYWQHARSSLLFLVMGLVSLAHGEENARPSQIPAAPAGTGRQLHHILIADTIAVAQTMRAEPTAPFVVLSPSLSSFDAAEINKRLAAGINRPIEERLLLAITQVIEGFFRQNEYPAATAIVPSQNIAEGDVRILLTLGSRGKSLAATEWKIRRINMQGARWFSESLLREKLRIEQGALIRYSDLDQAIGWTNNNPFRRVRVQLDPVPLSNGEADLTIAVQEALPLKFTASYSNSGNDVVGRNQYTAGITYGNVWGRDHQVSYQYITTDRPKFFQAHGLDYRIPLPWRHNVQVSASYLIAKPEILDGIFVQTGETATAEVRYTVPVRTGDSPTEVYGAFNFKETNNNLAYYGTQVNDTKTDIFQFTLGASSILRDKRGGWLFGATLTASPGGINSRNTDVAFDASRFGTGDSARFGARADYIYGNVSAQRLLSLSPGWDWTSRAIFQASPVNLLPSEMLTVGGASTVRGFPEGVLSGDKGFVFTNELLFPSWKKNLPRLSKTRGPLETRPLVFLDMAKVSAHETFATDPQRVALASAGVGLRMNLATNFSLSADYGWQLTYLPYPVDKPRGGHIRATLAF